MYIKYELARRKGWNYIFNVDEVEVQYISLKEKDLDRWGRRR